MKIIAFILQQKSALSLVDWDSLFHEQDPKMIFVLITEKGRIDAPGTQAQKKFTAVIELEQFEFMQAKPAMDKIFAQYFQTGDQTRIATIHEFQLELAAQLRDYYREAFNTQGPGLDVIQNFRNKLLMKKQLGPKGIKLPKYIEFDPATYKNNPDTYLKSTEKFLGFPMFVKPVDSAGSINTAFIQDMRALRTWCDKASESTHVYEIDEFIDGTLFHCDSVIKNGQVQFTLVSKYLHPNADAFSGKALATMTLNPATEEYNRLKQFAEKALSHFPILPDGMTHLEVFKKTSNNELVFLEVAARAPGGVAPEMYKIRTGVDIRKMHLLANLYLDITPLLEQLHNQSKWGPFASMYQLVAPYHGGTISTLKPPIFHGGGFSTEWRCHENEIIKPASSIANVIMSTVFWNDDYEALEQDFRLLDQQQIIEITPTPARNLGIIIHSISAYDMDWQALVPATLRDIALVLIANPESIKKLTQRDREAFIAIYTTQSFDFVHLKEIFHLIHQAVYRPGDTTRVSTVAEYDMIVTAKLRDHFRNLLSIEGPDLNTILNFRDKLQMKAVLANKGVRMPRYVKFDRSLFLHDEERYLDNLQKQLDFPIFAKPIDGAASIGTTRINNKKQLRHWCNEKLTVSQDFELDEYIEGKLFHCDSIIKNSEIVFTFVSKYLHPNADARVGLPLATITMDASDPDYQRLKDFAEHALNQFPVLPDGCTHLEVFISKQQELVFLEVAARPPGSRAPEMYQLRTNGMDIRAIHTKSNLGLPIDDEITHLLDKKRWGPYASMWDVVSPTEDSIIEELHPPMLDSEYWINWKYQRQDTISGGIYNGDVVASVVFWNNNYSRLVNDFNNLDNQRLLITRPSPVQASGKDTIRSSIPATALLKNHLLPEANTIHFNRLETLGCTRTAYQPTFFSKTNLAIGAAPILSLIGTPTTNTMRPYSPDKTEVDPLLFFGLLVGSATMVILLLYALCKALPTEEINQDDENLVLPPRF